MIIIANRRRRLLLSGASLAVLAFGTPVYAQTTPSASSAVSAPASDQAQSAPAATDQDAEGLGEIVVTAQRRRETLQRVPIAAVALTGDALLEKNVRDMTDLTIVSPSLKIDTPYGNTAPKITMRGVGSGSFNLNTETTVALYLDEFVLNPVSSKLGQLFDVDRVEVLRGPQGTLYGKNSTGGAINYITRRPDGTTAADLSATVGRFGEYDVSGGAQTAITDDLSVRVSFNRRYRDGYQYNSYRNESVVDRDDWGGRIGIVYKSGNVDAYLKLFADRSRADGYLIPTYGVNPDGSTNAAGVNPVTGLGRTGRLDDVASDVDPRSAVDNRGATLNLNVNLGGVTLTSISGFLHSTNYIRSDQDGSSANAVFIIADSRSNQVSQEFRLSSDTDKPLTWIVGVSFFHQDQKLNGSFDLPLFGLPPVNLATHEKTTSFAGFLDLTYHLSDRLSVVGGVRLTTDKKEFDHQTAFSLIGPFALSEAKRWTEPTYRAGLNFQLDPRTLLYVSYNHGYRSGAFDVGFPTTPDQFKPAGPEFVDSYEAGVKTSLFDNHLRIAADVFYEQFSDQQLLIQRSDPGSICCSLVNAGKSKIYGFEIDGVARLSKNFDVNFQGSVLRSRYLEFKSGAIDYSGQYLSNIPRYQLRIAPELRLPAGGGEFFLSPDIQFTGRQRVSTTIDPYGRDIQDDYTLVNGQLGYRWGNGRYSVFGWVRNATDKRYLLDAGQFTFFGYNQAVYAQPRTYGITISGRF